MITQEVKLTIHNPRVTVTFLKVNNVDDFKLSLDTFSDPVFKDKITPLKINTYVSSKDDVDIVQRITKNHQKFSKCPVTTLVQPPLEGCSIAVMIWYMQGVPIRRIYRNNCMSIEFENRDQWFFYAQNRDLDEKTFVESVDFALNSLVSSLDEFGFNYNNLLHTWFYIPQLTQSSNGEERYQIFNKSRRQIFQKLVNVDAESFFYPASTGIGCENSHICASAIAFQSPGYTSTMMDNDLQTPAYHYPEYESIEPPLFSRGMCLDTDKSSIVFVSGTASIINAKTVFENDVEGQTDQTIKNIYSLLKQYIDNNSLAYSFDISETIKYATIYIKNEKDYEKVKNICSSFFGKIPILYVKADVCRDSLMVEIECIASFNIP